jgi:hypothetical protein
MDDASRHPADDVLYDLVEGALDDARAQDVQRHVGRCAACAAFIEAATSGAVATSSLVSPMPADAVAALDVAVAGAWRERVAGIAVAEQAADAVAPAFETAPLVAAGSPTTAMPVASPDAGGAPKTRRRARWLVPALAFVVLGALAGTSWQAGEQRPAVGAESASKAGSTDADEAASTVNAPASESPAAREADAAAIESDSGVAAAAGTSTDAASGAAAGGPAAGAPPLQGDATLDGAVAPPVAPEGFEDDGVLTCIATRDETKLFLPDGRVAQLVTSGPLGIYVVCG